MTWPVSTIVRTVKGTFPSSTATSKSGTVTFTPTSDVTNASGAIVVQKSAPIVVTLDSTGSFSVTLPVTDDKSLTPPLWAYDLTINVYGSKPVNTRIVLLFGDGSIVDLPSQLLVTSVAVPVVPSSPLPDTVELVISTPARGPVGPPGPAGLIPVFSKQNSLLVMSSGLRFYFEATRVITAARASVGTPAVGSSIVIGIRINGTSIATVTIPAGSYTTLSPLNYAVNAGDYATIDILAVGSTTSGSDLSVILSID